MQILDSLLGGSKSATTEEQQTVHSGEIFGLWQHLVQRYDIRELTDIFQNFAKDIEFKAMLTVGLSVLDNEITILEDEMDRLGITLPPRPPKSINTPSNTEILRDELMFRIIYWGVQNFLQQHMNTILQIQNKRLKDEFIKMEQKELDLYTKLSKYGKLKGWLFIPPAYSKI